MNMKKMMSLIFTLPLLGLFVTPVTADEDKAEVAVEVQEKLSPQAVVKQTATAVINEIIAKKDEFEKDPSLIYPLVEETLVPHFDFMRMARSAMGRYWRKASTQQQRRIAAEFKEMMVLTYATALLSYSGQEIEYPPSRFAPGATKVLVPTKVRDAGGPPIPINYRLRLNDVNKWLVYDVVIDGISLVTNYRGTFSREIQVGARNAAKAGIKDSRKKTAKGIDSLIAVLSAKNDKPSKKAAESE